MYNFGGYLGHSAFAAPPGVFGKVSGCRGLSGDLLGLHSFWSAELFGLLGSLVCWDFPEIAFLDDGGRAVGLRGRRRVHDVGRVAGLHEVAVCVGFLVC